MNKWAIDNFMTHIAAITIIIDRFETDIADLRDDLKIETKQYVLLPIFFHLYAYKKANHQDHRMSQYFHEIGCRVTLPTETERTKFKIDKREIINHKIAKLKIPLDFPKTRTPGISRRK
jgi:DNA-directed RNA polymerase I subunit RPA49